MPISTPLAGGTGQKKLMQWSLGRRALPTNEGDRNAILADLTFVALFVGKEPVPVDMPRVNHLEADCADNLRRKCAKPDGRQGRSAIASAIGPPRATFRRSSGSRRSTTER
jgi:hypothetical protein